MRIPSAICLVGSVLHSESFFKNLIVLKIARKQMYTNRDITLSLERFCCDLFINILSPPMLLTQNFCFPTNFPNGYRYVNGSNDNLQMYCHRHLFCGFQLSVSSGSKKLYFQIQDLTITNIRTSTASDV